MSRSLLAFILLLPAAGVFAQPAPGRQDTVAVTASWSRASTGAATTGAIYATVTASEPDRLLGASTTAASTTELHQSRMVGGVMEMRPVAGGLPVTPSAPIHMAPGGYHLMLMGLKRPLQAGDHVAFTLTFEHAGTVAAEAVVGGPGASAPPPLR